MKTALTLAALLIAGTATAQTRAEPYRALGTEPFWSLTIGRAQMTYSTPEGHPLTVAKPRPIIGMNGELYRTRTMTVDITHVRCSDGMSDRLFADTVRVTTARGTVNGCGGRVLSDQANLLAGTSWSISAINGRPVRLQAPTSIRFTIDRIEGRAGCNSFGGSYRFERGTLTPRDVIATQMACGGGGSQVETAFFRAIAMPLSVSRGGGTLVLSGRGGSVTLQRVR